MRRLEVRLPHQIDKIRTAAAMISDETISVDIYAGEGSAARRE